MMVILGGAAVVLSSIACLTILRGLVLQALWTWFVVETFHIQGLTLGQAIGLSLIVSFLTYQYDARNAEERRDKGFIEAIVEALIVGVLINGFAYVTGAVIHGVMA